MSIFEFEAYLIMFYVQSKSFAILRKRSCLKLAKLRGQSAAYAGWQLNIRVISTSSNHRRVNHGQQQCLLLDDVNAE